MGNNQVLEKLQSQEEEVRLQGVKDLAQMGAALPLNLLYLALGDSSWRVRKEAVEAFLFLPRAGELTAEIVELLHSQDNAGLRNAAVEILTRLGKQAVQPLVEELNCNDHDVRKFAVDILGDIRDAGCIEAIIRALSDPDDNVRAAAAENLGKIGAPEAVPALLDAMENAELLMRFTILEALGQIGEGVPIDRIIAYKDDVLVRKALFDCLGRTGGEGAIPQLAEGLADKMPNVREASIAALDRISRSFSDAVGSCLSGLSESAFDEVIGHVVHPLGGSNLPLKRSCIHLLTLLKGYRSAPRLLALLDDENIRHDAVQALVCLGKPAVLELLDQWENHPEQVRAYLCYLIGETGCTEGAERLFDCLGADDPSLVMASAQALGKLNIAEAIPLLAGSLGNVAPEVRELLLQAFSVLGQNHRQQVVDALFPLLRSEDADIRTAVVSAFGRLEGEDVQGHISLALKDESPLVRRAAVRALEGKAAGPHFDALIMALTDEDSDVRRIGAEILGSTGNAEAVDVLAVALHDEDLWVRMAVVQSLGRIGGEQATALVKGALDDPVGLVCIAALEAIADIAPDASAGVLVQALAHEDEEVVSVALQRLVSSGEQDWIPESSERLLGHPHWEVRLGFVRALADLQGDRCLPVLESRLLIEGEDLVRQQLLEILEDLRGSQR